MLKRLLAVTILFWLLERAYGQIPLDQLRGPVCGMVDPSTKAQVAVSPVMTRVNVVVTDAIAQAVVTQTFVNPFGTASEAAYIFPLPDQGSVHGMKYQYHDSIYVAEIMERTKAQEKYDSIKQNGGQAALLLQDRPNIFQQRIANIGAGETAHVEIRLSMALKYVDGELELAFPTMIGPRYGSGVPAQPGSWNPPENREGPGFQFNMLIRSGLELSGITSPSHPIEVAAFPAVKEILVQRQVLGPEEKIPDGFNRGVLLRTQTTYPNRDFVLRMKRAKAAHDFSFATYSEAPVGGAKGTGYFALSLYPDPALFEGKRPDMDIVLLVDVSGSQYGWPLERQKEISLNILSRLTPNDNLSVLSFSNDVQYAFGNETPLAATRENVARAENFVRGLSTIGGTELLAAVQKSLAVPLQADKRRYYIFLTDGFITNEAAILEAIRNHPSHPTIFTFGAGNSLNRYFLEECAKVGDGFATPLVQGDAAGPAVELAWSRIESPQLEGIEVGLGTLDASELIYPVSRKLYRGLPYTVYGKFTGTGTHTVTLSAQKAGQPFSLTRTVTVADNESLSWSVPKLWAREKIGRLMLGQGTTESNKAAIIQVSLDHQVLSNYTAFLASKPQAVAPGGGIGPIATDILDGRRHIAAAARFDLAVRGGLLFLEWSVPETVQAIRIFDMQGRLLFTFRPQGGRALSRWIWDGRDAQGRLLNRGRYLVSVQSANGVQTRSVAWDPGR